MKYFGYGGSKVIWEVLENYVVEEVIYHYNIGLRGFDINLFDKD